MAVCFIAYTVDILAGGDETVAVFAQESPMSRNGSALLANYYLVVVLQFIDEF